MIVTYWCPGPWPWEWFRTCTKEVPDPPPDPCKTPACVDAKAKLDGARNRFKSICNGLKMLNALSKLLRQVLTVPIWAVVVMALIAAIIGGPIAIVIWGLIAVYGISWILYFVVGRMAVSLAADLAQATTDIQSALTDVIGKCTEPCRGDLSIPVCQLE